VLDHLDGDVMVDVARIGGGLLGSLYGGTLR